MRTCPACGEQNPDRARFCLACATALAVWRGQVADLDLPVGIGVSTGEVLVSVGARPDLGEGMAFGDTVNVAARLQSAAAVDGVLVSDACRRLTERVVEYAAVPPVS